ncbi:MAG: hypothetical protein QOH50_2382 [Kribbellaceae bacterium]|jgi:hypothetical protein|nr:hypothetical protein [Kribbellaceae bacterium]
MGLLDMFKDKASELLQGASDKVSEATGIDLPIGDVADQVTESTDGLGETTQGLADAAGDQVADATGVDLPVDGVGDQVTQATDSLGEAGQNLADTATDSVGEAIDPGQKR